jgi:uncharacterized protein YlxW (UPF0749 family)
LKKTFTIKNFFWFGIFEKLDKKKRLIFLIGAYSIFLVISFTQWQKFTQNGSSVYGYRNSLIQERINNIEEMNKFIETENILLTEKLNQTKQINENTEETKLSRLNGLESFKKEGVEVIIRDSKAPILQEDEYTESLVHNSDLLKITNLLWALGAEAISINENRVLFNTEIVCLGPTILINDNIISSPFYIKAGGSFEKLMKIEDDIYINYLQSRNIEFFVKKMNNVNIPSANTVITEGG